MTHSGRIQSQPGLQGRRRKIRTEANGMKDFSQKTRAEYNAKDSSEWRIQNHRTVTTTQGRRQLLMKGLTFMRSQHPRVTSILLRNR